MSTNHTLDSLRELSFCELQDVARQIGMEQRPCGCGWGDDCFRFRILFHQAQDEDWCVQRTPDKPHAADLVRLSFGAYEEPGTDKASQWRQAIEVNLSTTSKEVVLPPRSCELRVARHHFDRSQIKRMAKGNIRLSTPMPIKELENCVWSVDKRFKVIRQQGKQTETLYFSLPNVPFQAVRDEATGTNSSRAARRVTIEQSRAQKEEEAKVNEFNSITYDSYWAKNEMLAELQRKLNSAEARAVHWQNQAEKNLDMFRHRRTMPRAP